MKAMCAKCGGSMKKGVTIKPKMQKGGSSIKKDADANLPISRETLKTIGLYKPLEYLSEKVARPIAKYFGVKQVRTFGGNPIKSKNQLKVNANKVKVKPKMQKGGMYGIPQENMGTSDQYGFGQKGGTVKKPLKKTRIIDSKIPMKGPGAPVYKPLLAKKGGAVKKMKTGGSTKATKFAALAPPYNKATFADRIAGAKKKK